MILLYVVLDGPLLGLIIYGLPGSLIGGVIGALGFISFQLELILDALKKRK